MSTGEFDSIMLKTKIGASLTLRRLTPAERWCFVAGVLCVAGESPIRGALLLTEHEPANAQDIAESAGVPKPVAESTVAKLKQFGKLADDQELGCLIVTRWHTHQPEPRPSETRDAWRDRKQRQRDKTAGRHGDVTAMSRDVPRDVTAMSRPEVEVRSRSKGPPVVPPEGGPNNGRKRDRQRFDSEVAAYTAEHFPALPAREATHAVRQALRYGQAETLEQIRAWIAEHFPDLHHQLPEDQP